ncbi:hypothetical protein ACN47E_005996 [Coniothyrium glycines]
MIFDSSHSGRQARRQRNYWECGIVYQPEVCPTFSSEAARPSPQSAPATRNELPSRISALNRRAAVVSGSLAHLNAVVKPLEFNKAHEISDWHMKDLCDEYQGVAEAISDFVEQMREVFELMREMNGSRRKTVGSWEKIREREWIRGKGPRF